MLGRLTSALTELVFLGGRDKTEKMAVAYQAICIW